MYQCWWRLWTCGRWWLWSVLHHCWGGHHLLPCVQQKEFLCHSKSDWHFYFLFFPKGDTSTEDLINLMKWFCWVDRILSLFTKFAWCKLLVCIFIFTVGNNFLKMIWGCLLTKTNTLYNLIIVLYFKLFHCTIFCFQDSKRFARQIEKALSDMKNLYEGLAKK